MSWTSFRKLLSLHFQGRAVGTILHQAGFVLTEQTSLPGLWFFCQDPQQDGDSECPVSSWGLSSTKVRLQSLDVALFLFIIIHFGFFHLFTFCKTLFLQKYSCIGSLSYIGSTSPFTNTVLVQRSGYFMLSSWPLSYVYDGSFSVLWLTQEICICLACIWERRICIHGNVCSFISFMRHSLLLLVLFVMPINHLLQHSASGR